MKVEIFEKYNKHYERFYGKDDYGTKLFDEEQELIEKFEKLYKENEVFRTFIATLSQIRGDCYTSDRELASMMLAYEETASIMTKRFNEV